MDPPKVNQNKHQAGHRLGGSASSLHGCYPAVSTLTRRERRRKKYHENELETLQSKLQRAPNSLEIDKLYRRYRALDSCSNRRNCECYNCAVFCNSTSNESGSDGESETSSEEDGDCNCLQRFNLLSQTLSECKLKDQDGEIESGRQLEKQTFCQTIQEKNEAEFMNIDFANLIFSFWFFLLKILSWIFYPIIVLGKVIFDRIGCSNRKVYPVAVESYNNSNNEKLIFSNSPNKQLFFRSSP